ncbi:hypothetical protein KR074_004329, partial [Drosophila pseudoananassae]
KSLIEILRRNLRAEIRHEILNIPTESISKLREICRRRECFLEEVKRDQIYKKGTPFKSNVSELLQVEHKESESEFFEDEEGVIEAMSLICWNCRKEGHRYQDCTAPRKVNNGDGRPYTIVKILDRNIKGLMDTGASMSCIGGQFAQEVLGSKVPIHRVFNNVSTADGSKQNIIVKSRSAERIQNYLRNIRKLKKVVISSLLHKHNDIRPFSQIQILGQPYLALLDSGANKSVIGGALAKRILAEKNNFKSRKGMVKTADGQMQNIARVITVSLTFNTRH